MGNIQGKSLRCFRMAILMVLLLPLVNGACSMTLNQPGKSPKRKFVRPEIVQAQVVESTWRFETVFSPNRFQLEGQDWLAVDSKGRPALAYGGSQLNFAWFDGIHWQVETIDARPGAGKYAHLIFDANDQPHILYATGAFSDLSLDHMYRDAQGWRQETIDPDFCFGQDLDAVFDRQGNLFVVYQVSPSCDYNSAYETQVRFARQTENGLEISLISEHGIDPSLVIDWDGNLHLGYLDGGRGDLRDMLYLADGIWQQQGSFRTGGEFAHISNLLIDSNLRAHFIYCYNTASGCDVYHTWLDENGWQTEQLGLLVYADQQPATLIDPEGRIYIFCMGDQPKILRRDPSGWQEMAPITDESGYEYIRGSAVIDQAGQIRAAYLKMPDYTIQYAVQQKEGWQVAVVDQGDEPYLSRMEAALAYDRLGQLHIGLYDAQHTVRYISRDSSGWQNEVVGHLRYRSNPQWIELAFDQDNQPHIFYQYDKAPRIGPLQLVHAFRENGSWISEEVPFDPNNEGDVRSPTVIGPDYQPGFLAVNYRDNPFFYRTEQGWKVKLTEGIHVGVKPPPQIAFPEEPLSGAQQDGVLPSIFYFDPLDNVLKFSAPGQSRSLVVPILDQADQPARIAMRQTGSQSTVFLVQYEVKSTENQGALDSRFRYARLENGSWRVYELNELYSPAFSNQSIGPDGSVYVADVEYGQEDWKIYYLEGRASTWKKSELKGYDYQPGTIAVAGMALDSDGGFCTLLLDLRSNALVLGCLESTG